MKAPILLLLSFLLQSLSFAQDAQFSQFYANPIYLNPALAGSAEQFLFTGNNGRATLTTELQPSRLMRP